MPIFDCRCPDCAEVWEVLVLNTTEQVEHLCPKCSQTGERMIGGKGVSFRLYGEGFEKRSHRDTEDWSC